MKSQPNRDYRSEDRVMTPLPLARAIVDALQPSGLLLEPCAGDNAFVDAMAPYGQVEWCEIERGRDFFKWTTHVDWICTNPPWRQFAAFLEHSLAVADNVVFLATANHWYTKHRGRMVRDAGFGYRRLLWVPWPPSGIWPATGFQLGAMHVARGYCGDQSNVWLDVTYDNEPVRRGGLGETQSCLW
jgi:hypothetical protein